MVTEVTPVNDRIMRLRIFHTPGVISLISLYAATEVNEFSVKEAFYSQLEMIPEAYLDIRGDFNATIGNVRDEYEIFAVPHGSRDESLSMIYFPGKVGSSE